MDIAVVAAHALPNEQEFCTECGYFVNELNDETGWCNDCSKELGYVVAPSVCPRCGEPSLRGLSTCGRCKYSTWLERNADEIERVMATQVVTVRVAKRVVQQQNRPICNSCQQPIKGGQKGRHYFCRVKPECIRGSNVYERNLKTKPQAEALELAITASLIFKLTASIGHSNRE